MNSNQSNYINEQSRARLGHQTLLQDYLELQKDFVLKKKKLQMEKHKKETLLTEVRGQFASCFALVQHLAVHKCITYHNMGLFAFHPRNIRFYRSQNLSEPSSRSLSYISQSSRDLSGEAYPVLQSNGFEHWFKDWPDLRSQKLTASTFGGAVGFWHGRRVQLWLEKLGFVKPFTRNLATCWNNIKEVEALERYMLITGNTIFFPKFQVYGKANMKEDWLAASPDGLVEEGEKEEKEDGMVGEKKVGVVKTLCSQGVLEIKCPYFNGDMVQASPYKRIPLYYIPQAQGLMEIMDKNWMDFYVWTINGSSLFRIYRDVEYWKILNVALSDFWWNHVQPARELCSKVVITDPLIQLRSFKPAPRHELCSLIVSKSKGIVDDSKLLTREIYGKLLN